MWLLEYEVLGLSSRELASAVWLTAFIIWAFVHKSVRQSVLEVLRLALSPKTSIPFATLVAYVCAIVWVLEALDVWSVKHLKDTILWFFFAGIIVPFSFVGGKYRGSILTQLLKDSVSVLIIFEFLVGTYTFPTAAELVLVPLVALIVMLGVIAGNKPEHAGVAVAISAVQVLFGGVVIATAAIKATADIDNLLTLDTLMEILLPVLLSLSLAPFAYALAAFDNFEQLFIRLRLSESIDRPLRHYAQRQILFKLKGSPHRARAFLQAHARDIMMIRSKADIDQLLCDYTRPRD